MYNSAIYTCIYTECRACNAAKIIVYCVIIKHTFVSLDLSDRLSPLHVYFSFTRIYINKCFSLHCVHLQVIFQTIFAENERVSTWK